MTRTLLLAVASAVVGGLATAYFTGALSPARPTPPPASIAPEVEAPVLAPRPDPGPLVGFEAILDAPARDPEPDAPASADREWRSPDGGLAIRIPANALPASTAIAAESVSFAGLPEAPPGAVAAFRFGPDGLAFAEPVVVTARVHRLTSALATGRLWWHDRAAGRWVDERTPVEFEGDRARFALRHFSEHAVSEDGDEPGRDDPLDVGFDGLVQTSPPPAVRRDVPPPQPPPAGTAACSWSAGGGTAELLLTGIELSRAGSSRSRGPLTVLAGDEVHVDVTFGLRGTSGAEARFALELVFVSAGGAVPAGRAQVSRSLSSTAAGETFTSISERIVVRADPTRFRDDGWFEAIAVAPDGGRARFAAPSETLQIRAYPLGRLRLLPQPVDVPPGFAADFAPADRKDLALAIPRATDEPFAAFEKVTFELRSFAPGDGGGELREYPAIARGDRFVVLLTDLVPKAAIVPGLWRFEVVQGARERSRAELTASLYANGKDDLPLRVADDERLVVRLAPRPPLTLAAAPELRAGYLLTLRGRDVTAGLCERGIVLSTPVELHAGRAWLVDAEGGIDLDRRALAKLLAQVRQRDPLASLELGASAELWAGRTGDGAFHPVYRCAAAYDKPLEREESPQPSPRPAEPVAAETLAAIRFTAFGLAPGTGQQSATFTDRLTAVPKDKQPQFAVLGYEVAAPADRAMRPLSPDECAATVSRDGQPVLFLREWRSTGASDPGANFTAFGDGAHRVRATEWALAADGPWQKGPFTLQAGRYRFAAELARSGDGARTVLAATSHEFTVARDGFHLAKVTIARNENEDVTGSAAWAKGRLTLTSSRLVSTRSVDAELGKPMWVHHVVAWNDQPRDFWYVCSVAADGDRLVTANEQGRLHHRIAGSNGPFSSRWALEDNLKGLRDNGATVGVYEPDQPVIDAAETGVPDPGVGGRGVASFEFGGLDFLPIDDAGELTVTVNADALASVVGKGKGRLATAWFDTAPAEFAACKVHVRAAGGLGATGFAPGEFAIGATARKSYHLPAAKYGEWKGMSVALAIVHGGARGGGSTTVTLVYGRDPVADVKLGAGVADVAPVAVPAAAVAVPAPPAPVAPPAPGGEVSPDPRRAARENLILLLDLMGGGVQFLPFGGPPLAIRPGQPLADGTLSTGADGTATVVFPDGSRVRVGPDSHLRLSEPPPRDQAPFGRLDRGSADIDVRREDPARPPLRMETPDVAVEVRGTRYRLNVDEQGTTVRVDEGRTHLRGARLRRDGDATNSSELELVAGERAIALRAPANEAGTGGAPADWTAALSAASRTIGAAPDAEAVLASAEAWRDERVQALIDEFLRISTPAGKPNPGLRWDLWARVHGPGIRYTNARPDGETEATRHRWLWERAMKIPSVAHMTMAEYVRRRLLGLPLDATPAPATVEPAGEAPQGSAGDAAIAAIDAFIASSDPDRSQSSWRTTLAAPPRPTFDPRARYEWHVETSKGTLVVLLLPEVAPMHVASTIYLARLGFYDGLPFHRVIPGFMAQGGCPRGRGDGGPGYRMDGEFDAKTKHDRRGIVSAAHAGPGTDGSQFFVTFVPLPHLDGKHTVFGELVAGREALDALEAAGSDSGRLSEPITIERSWIVVGAQRPAPPRDARK